MPPPWGRTRSRAAPVAVVAGLGVLAVLVVLVAAACARSEQPLLERFFSASRLRDTTALQPIATVVFEPRRDGIVRTFRITAVGAVSEDVDGAVATKEVTVEAPVVLPDGRTVQKRLVMTMARGRGAAGGAGTAGSPGGWRVTGFRDAGVSAPSPPS